MGIKEQMIEDLKCGDATLITCEVCGNYTFVGVSQAYTSDDRPYAIGDCAQCLEGMRKLDGEKDVELMMEFRQKHWDSWVRFCLEHDYKPCVE